MTKHENEVRNLKGREIKDVPYSGLIESLIKISLICQTAGQEHVHLTKDDLIDFLNQIAIISVEGAVFAGASRDELAEVSNYLLAGMKVDREKSH